MVGTLVSSTTKGTPTISNMTIEAPTAEAFLYGSSSTLTFSSVSYQNGDQLVLEVYDDFTQALRHPGVDIVAICTPQHLHCENVLAAAKAGKHLLIEKPLCASLDEAEQVLAARRRQEAEKLLAAAGDYP